MEVYADDHTAAMTKELLDEFGLDIQTAVKVFLKQVIREKEIPFRVGLSYDERKRREEIERQAEYEEYFSGANLEHLKHSIAQAQAGKIVVHDLIEV